MRKLIILFFIFLLNKSFCQDSLSYKRHVDSILISRSRAKVKKIKTHVDSLEIRYFFEKNTKQLSLIEVIQPNMNDWIWIYNYHFIEGKLTMMSKYNNHAIGDKKRELALYYFKDNALVYREENKTQIEDIDDQMKRAEELKLKAPNVVDRPANN